MTEPESRPALFVETSALAAIILVEPEWRVFTEAVMAAACKTSAFNLYETVLAVAKQKAVSASEAHNIVTEFAGRLLIEILPLAPEMIPHAVAARERYGRGRKALNMGDCLSYAAAKQLALKLLYKGDDFAATDVNG